jgi:gamma-glutamyl-gamma-aminobutyrate hydrolase PuuD
MSENTPPRAGQPGANLPSQPTAAASASSDDPGQRTAGAGSGAGADAYGPAAGGIERESSDMADSESALEAARVASSPREEAARARADAVRETQAQEDAARVARAADVGGVEPVPVVEIVRPGAPPPGFGAPPDFDVSRPPPAGGSAATPPLPAYLKQGDSPWSVFGRTIAARARRLFDRAGQRITQRTLRIGVSARIFHPEPGAKGLRGKTLQYLEESVAHWVMSRDVMVFMIPTVGHQGMLHPSNIRLRDYAKHLDGLVLQGGADVSPQTYAATETRAEWPGDRIRDMYELELLYEFIESGKPVLGICRGCQLINVAFGGTLYQDIATEVPTAGVHVSEHYDQHRHAIRFPEGASLASMFPGRQEAIVNSIHHQAVKTLGRELSIEAVSAGDGLIEAVRYRRSPFVVGVQWHPEFHRAGGAELLDCTPLLDTFLRAARETRF